MPQPMPNSLLWFRRDLRVAEQGALMAAVEHARRSGGTVTPVFVLDDRLLKPSGANRLNGLFDALRALRSAGVPLQVIAGNPVDAIPRLAKANSADVFASADFGPYGVERDRRVSEQLLISGSSWNPVDSPYLVPPGTVLKGDGSPFSVFTPFKRVWLEHARGQRPGITLPTDEIRWADAQDLGEIPHVVGSAQTLPEMTEAAALAAAEAFLQRSLLTYTEDRNIPSIEGTSRLGAYLKYGLLHPRQLLASIERQIDAGSSDASTFLSELCWREFYADVLFRRPASARQNYAANMDLQTDDGPLADERFEAWANGRTGYPFIDAGMRQLLAEGWMHNRVRMAAASFLVKDLHLPWQRGARWFMQHLADGDLASNQHGWQWTAGTGTDAAPYFRIFNPILQGKKFDPDGVYISRWVPELAGRPAKEIHEPWLFDGRTGGALRGSAEAGTLFDVERGSLAYPSPIVDHATERDESLRRLKAVRGS